MDIVRKIPDDGQSHLFVGLDADFIFLISGMNLNSEAHILRDREIVDITALNHELLNFVNSANSTQDIILIMFLCGNDFLPQIRGLSLFVDGTFKFILMAYRIFRQTHKQIVSNDSTINFSRFREFLSALRPWVCDKIFPNWKRQQLRITDMRLVDSRSKITSSFDNYQSALHETASSDDWFKMCQVVLNYYVLGQVDWVEYYNFYYAPKLKNLIESDYSVFESEPTKPVLSSTQLKMVLPDFSLKRAGIVRGFKDTQIDHINYAGKFRAHEGIVIYQNKEDLTFIGEEIEVIGHPIAVTDCEMQHVDVYYHDGKAYAAL